MLRLFIHSIVIITCGSFRSSLTSSFSLSAAILVFEGQTIIVSKVVLIVWGQGRRQGYGKGLDPPENFSQNKI